MRLLKLEKAMKERESSALFDNLRFGENHRIITILKEHGIDLDVRS